MSLTLTYIFSAGGNKSKFMLYTLFFKSKLFFEQDNNSYLGTAASDKFFLMNYQGVICNALSPDALCCVSRT